jgi:hypothetical protein
MGHEHRIMKQKWSSLTHTKGDKIKDPTKVATNKVGPQNPWAGLIDPCI